MSSKAKRPKRKSKVRGSRRRKIVASCPEFALYEDGRLEAAPAVELAMKRARFANSSRPGAEDRLRLKAALWDLMEDAAGQFTGDPDELLEELRETLGRILLTALNNADGSSKRIRGGIKKVTSCVGDVESAITQMVRYRSVLPIPGDKSPGAWTWTVQHTAKRIFRESKARPTKSEIRRELEADGWGFKGHDPEENWKRVLRDAGLGSLPS